jgi:hypothetical protein
MSSQLVSIVTSDKSEADKKEEIVWFFLTNRHIIVPRYPDDLADIKQHELIQGTFVREYMDVYNKIKAFMFGSSSQPSVLSGLGVPYKITSGHDEKYMSGLTYPVTLEVSKDNKQVLLGKLKSEKLSKYILPL